LIDKGVGLDCAYKQIATISAELTTNEKMITLNIIVEFATNLRSNGP